MSTTITLSMETLLLGVPSLVAFSGAVTFVALRGYLTDAVEGHRLLAAADERSARWLFLRGYRRTPHAGPDVTPEPEPLAIAATAYDPDADEVGDEQPGATLMRPVLAVARWVGYALALVDTVVDFARTKFADALRTYRERNQVGTGETPWVLYDEDELRAEGMSEDDILALRDGLVRIPATADLDDSGQWARDAAITDGPDTAEPVQIVRVNHRYRDPGMTGQFPYVKVAGAARHAAPEPEMPAINATVPAQRIGDADADR